MPDHIFKTTQLVKFTMSVSNFEGTTGIKTFDFTTDGLHQYTNGFVKFKDESIEKQSKRTGERFLKKKYWRGTITIEFKIVNDLMLQAVRTLLRGIDNSYNLTTSKVTNIIIGDSDNEGDMISFNDYRLISDVSPSYVEENIMAGEELELEFESTVRVTSQPTICYSLVIDDNEDFIVFSDSSNLITRG